MGRILIGSIIAAIGASAAGAMPAAAAPGDVAASRTYLRISLNAAREVARGAPAERAGANGLITAVREGCAGALSTAPPKGRSAETFAVELEGAALVARGRTDATAERRFVRQLRGIQWQDAHVMRIAKAYQSELSRQLALPVPDICRDVSAWASGGFAELPPPTVNFVHRFLLSLSGPGEIPWRLVLPYLRDQMPQVKKLRRLEASIERNHAARLADTVTQLSIALGYRT